MSKSRLTATWLLAALLLWTATFQGCAWGNSFFQIDSDSRTPYFGFNLLSR